MAKFLKFTAPDKSDVYINHTQVVQVSIPLTGAWGTVLNLSNGRNQAVTESIEEVMADLEGID